MALGCVLMICTTIASLMLCTPLARANLEWTYPWIGRAITGTVVNPLPGEVASGFVLLTKEGERVPITHYNTMRGLPSAGDRLSKPAHETTFDITYLVEGKEVQGTLDTFHPLESDGPVVLSFALLWVVLYSGGTVLVSLLVSALSRKVKPSP